MQKIPFSSFCSSDYPSDERLAVFQQMTTSIYETHMFGSVNNFFIDTFGYQVNQIMFHEFKSTNVRFRRSHKHLKGNSDDFLVLQIQLAGEELLHMEHGIIRLLPGHIYLRDWSYPFDAQISDMHILGILIPRELIHFSHLFHVKNPVLSWSLSDPKGALLWKLWKHIFDELNHLCFGDAEAMVHAFISFLNSLVITRIGEKKGDHPKMYSMEQYVQAQLRGDINTENLCEYFHVSRATVFRLFKKHGGLKHYIHQLRLNRCYIELKNSDPALVTIGEVASGWGYIDPKTFNRKFRKQFGLPPSKIFGSGLNTENYYEDSNKKILKSKDRPYINFKNWLTAASLNN